MSDPVTNVELDDVLSSIRRLVSDRDPAPRGVVPFAVDPAPAPDLATPDVPADPARADAPAAQTLLLTPALRVDPALTAEAAPAADPLRKAPTLLFPARPIPAPEVDPALPEAGLVARLAARLEAAVTQEAAAFEPDGSEDDPVIDWSAPMLGEPPIFRSRQSSAPAAEAGSGPVRLILPLTDADNDADAPLRDAIEAAAPVIPDPDAVPTFHHRSEIAVPPAAVAPEAPALDAGLGAEAPAATLRLGDGQVLDEAILRAIVTDVVRQELQGALGERITRNVRKLVRREIFKVLSAEELE